jgi:hypothetical protein
MATLAEVEGMAHFSAFIQISIRAMLRTWRMMRKQKKIRRRSRWGGWADYAAALHWRRN